MGNRLSTGQGGEKKLADAYRNRGLNPKSLDL
jgi:hypothetical protein